MSSAMQNAPYEQKPWMYAYNLALSACSGAIASNFVAGTTALGGGIFITTITASSMLCNKITDQLPFKSTAAKIALSAINMIASAGIALTVTNKLGCIVTIGQARHLFIASTITGAAITVGIIAVGAIGFFAASAVISYISSLPAQQQMRAT